MLHILKTVFGFIWCRNTQINDVTFKGNEKYFLQMFYLWFKALSCAAEHKTMLVLATAQGKKSQRKVVTRRSGETGEAINPHFGDGHWGVTSCLPQDRTGSNSRQRWRRGSLFSSEQKFPENAALTFRMQRQPNRTCTCAKVESSFPHKSSLHKTCGSFYIPFLHRRLLKLRPLLSSSWWFCSHLRLICVFPFAIGGCLGYGVVSLFII